MTEVVRQVSDDESRSIMEEGYERLRTRQAPLAHRVGMLFRRNLDEVALSLGYYVVAVVWAAFDRTFGDALVEVSEQDFRAVEQAVELEEELRARRGHDPFDLDDVVTHAQPSVMAFVNEQFDETLELAGRGVEIEKLDVDHVRTVYRWVVTFVLALSHAVQPPQSVVMPETYLD